MISVVCSGAGLKACESDRVQFSALGKKRETEVPGDARGNRHIAIAVVIVDVVHVQPVAIEVERAASSADHVLPKALVNLTVELPFTRSPQLNFIRRGLKTPLTSWERTSHKIPPLKLRQEFLSPQQVAHSLNP
jgi:hypothetical protein